MMAASDAHAFRHLMQSGTARHRQDLRHEK